MTTTTQNLIAIEVAQLADVCGGKKEKQDDKRAAAAPATPPGMTQFGFNDVKQGFSFSLTRT